ncbi:hypothetical protein EI427_12640 [Flammeovirga pectinis]|uniref:histidine kinase n=1 Tax=Flammeovirga pectinis TaxID=2494373 RepID=A0A3S9P4N7_9BACT|nr:ATP-binding protein [Flammeovirga pectinis]AZQ63052.1 hypothetical protein EI427_12640 [Flammeovirga pectinis]
MNSQSRSIWWVITLTTFCFLIIGYKVYENGGSNSRKLAFEVTKERAVRYGETIESRLQTLLSEMRLISNTMQIIAEDQGNTDEILEGLLDNTVIQYTNIEYMWMVLVDSNSTDNAFYNPIFYDNESMNADGAINHEIKKGTLDWNEFFLKERILASRESFVTLPKHIQNGSNNLFAVHVVLPFFSESDKFIGAVGSAIRLSFFQNFIKDTDGDDKRYVCIAAPNGQIVGSVNPSDIGKNDGIPAYLFASLRNDQKVSRIVENSETDESYYEMLFPIKIQGMTEPWVITTRVPLEAVLRSSIQSRNFTMALVFLLWVIITSSLTFMVSKWKSELGQRKVVVEEYKKTNELLRNILDNSDHIMMYTLDRDKRLLSCNNKFMKITEMLTGVRLEKGVYLLDIFDSIKENNKNIFEREYFDRCIKGEDLVVVDKFKGYYFEQFFNPFRNTQGEIIGVTSFLVDVTELKDAQKQLEVHKNHLELLVEKRTKHIERQNEALRTQSEKLRVAHDEIRESNLTLEHKNDEIASKNIAMHDSLMDTESALSQLKEMQDQLVSSEKLASIGQLTAGIAHEINNPINFVANNVLPLKDDIEDLIQAFNELKKFVKQETINEIEENYDITFVIQEINDLLKGVEEGANRTTQIVMDLKTFARMDSAQFKEANLEEGIDTSLTLLNNKLKNRVEVHKDYGNIPLVNCNESKVNQVFMNILNNAEQAIKGEGNLSIKTWSDEKMVYIRITDDGGGMDKETVNKIFDPFFTTKPVGLGTGLGMSISFGIIQDHKGDIKVDSEVGKGTSFTIILPIIGPQKIEE